MVRPLALDARTHVIVQQSNDKMNREGTLPWPTSVAFLTWVQKVPGRVRKRLTKRPQSLPRSSVRRAPHPIPPLPRHLADQTTRFHPGGPFNYLGSCGTLKERYRHEWRNDGLPWSYWRPVGESFRKIAIGKGNTNLQEQVCPAF